MACKLDGYAGRLVMLEYMLACGDVDPRSPSVNWQPIGPMTTKSFNLTWETSDTSTDQTVGNLMSNIATWQSLEISGSGIATPEDGTRSNLTALTKHIANPGPDYSHQPIMWLRMTFPDLTFIAYMIGTTISRDAPSGEPVTYEFSATATASDFGLIVLDTPDPDAPAATSITMTPAGPLELEIGDTEQLSAVVAPSGASQSVIYSSSDPLVASVSVGGLVTASDEGTATITITSMHTPLVTATVSVTVTDPEA